MANGELRDDGTRTHPERIGPYRVITRIASGGMAEIFLAKRLGDAGFRRPVVIKRMFPHLADEPALRTSLLDEGRLMTRLRHPNIVGVHELSCEAAETYLVMELLRGESLSGLRQELRARGESMDPALAVHIVAEICAGLHAAHELRDERGELLHVVHRDMSPHNVFVTFDGEVKILDFGIACFGDRAGHTLTGMTKGKFAYMSPEQFAGETLDRRADIFAVGTLLHELLTGKRLFARASDAQILKAALHDPIPLPSQIADDSVVIPETLDTICMKALARDRDERFATAEELREGLRELLPSLDPRQRARERLIELTRRVLPQRFAETEALLRRSLELPAKRAEDDAVWPDPEIEIEVTSHGAPDPAAQRAGRARARRISMALLAACAVIGLGAWGLASELLHPAPSAALEPERAAAITHDLRPEPLPPAPPAEARAHLDVESTPVGARVSIDGESVGITPLDHDIEKSPTPRTITVELEGFAPFTDQLTPEVDQRLLVRLMNERPRRARPRFYAFD